MFGRTATPGLAALVLFFCALFSTAGIAQTADLAISIDDGIARAVAGATQSTYRVDVINRGPDAARARVAIAISYPDLLCAWQCTSATGGAVCPVLPVNYYVDQTHELPSGSTLVYTGTCSTTRDAVGTVHGYARIEALDGSTDPTPADNNDEDVNTVDRIADLAITTTSNSPEIVAGGAASYTIVAENRGPSTADGVNVASATPAGAFSCFWRCLDSSAGSVCNANGTGDLAHTIRLQPNERVSYGYSCSLRPETRGTIVNTATISSALTDPEPANNTASDTRTLALRANYGTLITANADRVRPDDVLNYRISVGNSGPSALFGARYEIRFPSQCIEVRWQCEQGLGDGCPSDSGNTDIVTTTPIFLHHWLLFSATCRVAPTTPDGATLLATATLTDPDTTNLNATAASSHAAIVSVPRPIPALSPLALATLALGVAVIALRRRRIRAA